MFQLFAKAHESSPLIRPKRPLTFLTPNKEHSPVVVVDLSQECSIVKQRVLQFASQTLNEHSPLVISPSLARAVKQKWLRHEREECSQVERQTKKVRCAKIADSTAKAANECDDVEIIGTKMAAKNKKSTKLEKITLVELLSTSKGTSESNCTTQIPREKLLKAKIEKDLTSQNKQTDCNQTISEPPSKAVEEQCINGLIKEMVVSVAKGARVLPLKRSTPKKSVIPDIKYVQSKQIVSNVSKCLEHLQRDPCRAYEIKENDRRIIKLICKITCVLRKLELRSCLPSYLNDALSSLVQAICRKIGSSVHYPNVPFVFDVVRVFHNLPEMYLKACEIRLTELMIRTGEIKNNVRFSRFAWNNDMGKDPNTKCRYAERWRNSLARPHFAALHQEQQMSDSNVIGGSTMFANTMFPGFGFQQTIERQPVSTEKCVATEPPIHNFSNNFPESAKEISKLNANRPVDMNNLTNPVFPNLENNEHLLRSLENNTAYQNSMFGSFDSNNLLSSLASQQTFTPFWAPNVQMLDSSLQQPQPQTYASSEVPMISPMCFPPNPVFDFNTQATIKSADNPRFEQQQQPQLEHYPFYNAQYISL